MKRVFFLLLASFFLASCGSSPEGLELPKAARTFPEITYEVVKKLSQRTGHKEITRMVGWDEEFYYFDWYQEGKAIPRGIGRSNRLQFDNKNNGALTLEKGNVTVKNGQVRTLKFE